MRPRYRARQFFKAIAASVTDEERELVERSLTGELRPLFFNMAVSDQRHSLDVARALGGQATTDPDLLASALLHDCGKALGRIGVWQRVALVLAQAAGPAFLEQLTASGPAGLRRTFFIQQEHARLGAELAQQAGAPPAVVELIRRHEDRNGLDPVVTTDDRLRALQVADSNN